MASSSEKTRSEAVWWDCKDSLGHLAPHWHLLAVLAPELEHSLRKGMDVAVVHCGCCGSGRFIGLHLRLQLSLVRQGWDGVAQLIDGGRCEVCGDKGWVEKSWLTRQTS